MLDAIIFVANGEEDRVLGVEEVEERLVRLELMGKRDLDGALGVDFSSVFSSDFINAISLNPTITLEAAKPEKSL